MACGTAKTDPHGASSTIWWTCTKIGHIFGSKWWETFDLILNLTKIHNIVIKNSMMIWYDYLPIKRDDL